MALNKAEEEADKRQMELILLSLAEIKPYFLDDNVTDIWIDNGVVSIKMFGKPREDTPVRISAQKSKNILVQIANYMNLTINYLDILFWKELFLIMMQELQEL